MHRQLLIQSGVHRVPVGHHRPPGDDPAMTMFLRTLRRVAPPRTPADQVTALRIGLLRAACRTLDAYPVNPVELRDKVAPPSAADADGTPVSAVASGTLRDQVVEALVGLGFAAKPAEKAVDEVLGGSSGPDDSSGVLRAALSRLGPR